MFEGRLLSSDFLLPAGEAGCETAMLAFLQEDNTGVPTWEDMTGGKEFTVVFDMPYGIPGILKAQDVIALKFYRHKWYSTRTGSVPHLYDGYKNGGSDDVSVQGLVMTYDEGTGVFTVTDDDFTASAKILTDLPVWVKGRDVARAEYKKLLNHLNQKRALQGYREWLYEQRPCKSSADLRSSAKLRAVRANSMKELCRAEGCTSNLQNSKTSKTSSAKLRALRATST
ncbi:hypothetical protein Bbelb_362370, partial [Branchiostoma belcheri]